MKNYLLFLLFITCTCTVYADEPGDVSSLISACADGQMEICDQISRVKHPQAPISPLDAMALAFSKRVPTLDLVDENHRPELDKAYPLIVEDYFSSERISTAEREKWFLKERLVSCSQHYHARWRMEKNWWPVDNEGNPDWRSIYPHVLDHYFGYCVRQ